MQNTFVLITGATRGLGREVARQLAERGATVFVSARDPAKAAQTAAELGHAGDVRALPVGLDVNEERAVRETAAALRRDPGRLDVLINNAAAYVDWTELASAADLSASQQVLAANLFGPWRAIQALLPLLRESRHPRIINLSSGAGSHGDQQFGLIRRGGARSKLRNQQGRPECPHGHPRRRVRGDPDPRQRRLPRPYRDLARSGTDGRTPYR